MKDAKTADKILRISNTVLIIVLVLVALITGIIIKDDWVSPKTDFTEKLTDGWIKVNEDGTEEPVSGDFNIGNTVPVTFYRTLPQVIEDDQILRLKCPYYSVDAYVDGESIYHAGPAKIGRITTTLGNVFALIPLKKEYAGKDIYITVEPRHYFYEVKIKDAAITTMAMYALQRIADLVPYACLCLLLAMIALVSLALSLIFRISKTVTDKKLSYGFICLSVFSISAIGWMLTDFHVAGMLTGRMALSGIINYVSFMLCPVLFAGVLVFVFGMKPFFKLIFILSELNFAIQIVLFVTGVADLPDGILFSQTIMALQIFGMVYFGMSVMKGFAEKNVIMLAAPTICFVIFAIVGVVSYIANQNWMLYVALAMTFYVITVATYLLINLWRALKTNVELKQVKRIAYVDDLSELGNRRAYDEYILTLDESIKEGREDGRLTVVMLDVNGLKKSNDIYGHSAGDELITGSAECIKETFKDIGKCFRTGGDEFIVIAYMDEPTYLKKKEELADRLDKWVGTHVQSISMSVGKADSGEFPGYTLEQLVDIADKRMYENKQNYYASQFVIENKSSSLKKTSENGKRRERYLDDFSLSKYTMPIIRQIAEIIPGGFFIYREDEKRELIYFNRKVLEIYGCNTVEEFRELTGCTFEGMVYPDDFQKIQDSIDNQIDDENGDGMDHVIYRIRRKDGEIRWADDYGHFSRTQDYGDIYYVFINDITDGVEHPDTDVLS